MSETLKFEPSWKPMSLGSLPHERVDTALALMAKHFPDVLGWPQLPRRTHLENMYIQFSERFPGVVLNNQGILVDRRRDLDRDLERLYLAYLESDLDYGHIAPSYAAGMDALLTGKVTLSQRPLVCKGQVTGPVSWGLTVLDQNRRPILYDEVLADAVGKHLRLKAAWQEQALRSLTPQTIIMVDEPYMASFGSAFVSLSRSQVMDLLEEVFAGLAGLKGIHCCGNTDWSILLGTSVDVLSLDAYDYAHTLSLYAEDVARFVAGGGVIAWGIVPAGPAADGETVESLVGRLERALQMLVAKGVPHEALGRAGLVTPSCGLGSLSEALAERVLGLTVGVSEEMRRRYAASASQNDGANVASGAPQGTAPDGASEGAAQPADT